MASAPDAVDRKLRILCLHGYLQNAEVFRGRIGSLRKGLKSRAEFFFVDAPHLAQGEEAEIRAAGGTGDHPRAWWTWEDLNETKRPSKAAKYSGWEASVEALEAALISNHPIDGILGFSQGATAAALFLAGLRNGSLPSAPRFAVLVSGFLPRDPSYADILRHGHVSTPTLFIHGSADELVPLERAHELQETFAEGATALLEHPGAHFVPTCTGAVKQQIVQFLDKF
ncbi:Esterase OVCA2 [Coccomyxa sp. Obi]|nr:Esterase OVCA2 [Coccomyxa sp. Obi]